MLEFKRYKQGPIMNSIKLHSRIQKLRISFSLILGIGPFSKPAHVFSIKSLFSIFQYIKQYQLFIH